MTNASETAHPTFVAALGLTDGSQVRVTVESTTVEVTVHAPDAEGVMHWVTLNASQKDASALSSALSDGAMVAVRRKYAA